MSVIFNSIDEENIEIKGLPREFFYNMPPSELTNDEKQLLSKLAKPILNFEKLNKYLADNLKEKK